MKTKKEYMKLTIPVRMVWIAKKKNRSTTSTNKPHPYYTKFSMYDKDGEPLVERDFEG